MAGDEATGPCDNGGVPAGVGLVLVVFARVVSTAGEGTPAPALAEVAGA